MTSLGSRATVATTVLVLTLLLSLVLAGCGSGAADAGADSGGNGAAHPRSSSSAPAPSGPGSHAPSPTGSEDTDGARDSKEEPGDAPAPKGGVPRPADVDQKNADDVGEGTLTAMWTYDTAVDRGPHDAGVRTAKAGWLTAKYARQLRGHRSRSAPGAQWQTWARYRAHTTVELERTEDAAKPDDTDTEAWRQWTVTTTPHGRGGWTQKPTAVVAYVQLVRAAAGEAWRVAGVTVR